ncbi:hypothetical protein Sjap_007676 [Stephania japonica]|uniref:Uncharacterized protein n=1 Tax=Stephania japonica TaxID=461633 RepID=A0AAP0JN60_9MAGN
MKGPYRIEKAKEDGDLEKPFLGPSSSSTIMASSSSISVGFSSPTQSGIMSELGLSLAEFKRQSWGA